MSLSGQFDTLPTQISREIFFNVGGAHGFARWVLYLLLLLALCYLIYTLAKRISVWRHGKPRLCTDAPAKRIVLVVKYILLQTKILTETYAGIMHASLFYGFAILALVTFIVFLQEDFTLLLFNYRFLYGDFYLAWSLAADIAGLLIAIGLGMAFYRRYISKPNRLDTNSSDTTALVLLLLIILTGFGNEAMRIAISGFPDFEVFSPVGYLLAHIVAFLEVETLKISHGVSWWLHTLSAMLLIALLAKGKLGHIVVSVLNIYFSPLENENPQQKFSTTLIHPAAFETADSLGVSKIDEFSWKDLLDLDACTRCGRCQDQCPAWLTNKPLSPKKFINDLKSNMDRSIPDSRNKNPISQQHVPVLIGDTVQPEEFWSCTNCAACMQVCPVNIEHVPKVTDLRRFQVLIQAEIPAHLQTALTNMENHANPYGFAAQDRDKWIPTDLDIKPLAEQPDVDYLFFSGCAAAYDQRNKDAAIAFLRILAKAGYKTGILGNEEVCCGDAALRAGNDYLFQVLAGKNIQNFMRYDIDKIVTTCPHGYNTLKKEYKRFADMATDDNGNRLDYNLKVYHHVEVIEDLIKRGRIHLRNNNQDRITYHDSCFLGRYNEIYAAPRNIITMITGAQPLEMRRHHANSLCCGAGGSRMWHGEESGTRINHYRVNDALATGANTLATACPFCLTMLSDGINDLDAQQLKVRDIAQLTLEAMA